MFSVWNLWGDVWVVDRDPVTIIVGNLLIFCFMVVITLAVLAVWLPFMGLKWALDERDGQAFQASIGSSKPVSPNALTRPCPNCGSTASRDIRPCVRCGH